MKFDVLGLGNPLIDIYFNVEDFYLHNFADRCAPWGTIENAKLPHPIKLLFILFILIV
jgi:hypothetical protein